MKRAFVTASLVCLLLPAASVVSAAAQNHGPGGLPPGQHGPAGPGSGPGGPGIGPSAGPAGSGTGSTTGSGAGGSASGTARSAVQFGPVGRWWDDKHVIGAIGLTRDQQRRMDGIFDTSRPAIEQSYKQLKAEEAQLAALNKAPQVDQARVFAAIDAVSQARNSLEKAYTQMLLQIRQQMDVEQINKLQGLK